MKVMKNDENEKLLFLEEIIGIEKNCYFKCYLQIIIDEKTVN